MIGNYKLEAQKKHPKYDDAKNILESIIKGVNPEEYTQYIINLYGEGWGYVKAVLVSQYNKLSDEGYEYGEFRPENKQHPIVLSGKREGLKTFNLYNSMQNSLRVWLMPDDAVLEHFFGKNTPFIKKMLNELSFKYKLNRKCKLPMPMHYGRCTGVMDKLMDTPEYASCLGDLDKHDANTIMFEHDIEENYYLFEHKNISIDRFLKAYVPKHLIDYVVRITNKRDLLLKHVKKNLEDDDIVPSIPNIAMKLGDVREKDVFAMADIASSILKIIEAKKGIYSFDELKFLCYPEYILDAVYGEDRIKEGIGEGNYAMKEISKYFIVSIAKMDDHGDNVHGNGALELEGRIKSVVKQGITGDALHSLHYKNTALNNLTAEALEIARTSAYYFFIDKLLEKDSIIDFVDSMMQSFKSLQSIFYQDRTLLNFDYMKSTPKTI